MIYLAIVSLLWAVSFGLIGSALAGIDPFFVASVRLGLALLVFAPFLRPARLSGREIGQLFGCGAIQFGLMYAAYIQAFAFLPSHLVALFSILTPLYVVLIHDLRHRRWTPLYFAAAALSVVGAAVIKAGGSASGELWIGFALMQVSGLSFAFGQVYYRDWKRERPALKDHELFAVLYAGGFSLALLASLGLTDWSGLEVSPKQWRVLVYLGIVASGLGFFLWNRGAARTNAGTLAVFNNAVVPLAILVSLFVFGEITDASGETLLRLCLGGALIGGSVLLAKPKRREAAPGT